MAKSPNYPDLVGQAEEAVQGVKDPNLKSIAFQKVLEELLGGGTAVERPVKKARAASPGASRKSSRRGGPIAHIRDMIGEGFFKKPKTITDVKVELENRGHHIPLTTLSNPLKRLCQAKELRRKRSDGQGSKKTFVYSNW